MPDDETQRRLDELERKASSRFPYFVFTFLIVFALSMALILLGYCVVSIITGHPVDTTTVTICSGRGC